MEASGCVRLGIGLAGGAFAYSYVVNESASVDEPPQRRPSTSLPSTKLHKRCSSTMTLSDGKQAPC